MKQQIRLYKLLVLGLALLAILACSPLDYFTVSRSSGQASTPELKQLPVTPAWGPAATVAYVASPATLTPGSNGPLPEWKVFMSEGYHYALSYPSDWTVTTEKAGTMGEAQRVERVIFRQPGYGKPNQFSTVTIEAAERAYTITAQCQGQSQVIAGFTGCRRSMPKGQNPAQEMVLFQAQAAGKGSAYFYVQLVYDDAKYVDAFDHMLSTWKFTAVAPAPSPSAVPPSGGTTKTYTSAKYSYVINYPSNWALKVQTMGPAGQGRDPENVLLTPPGGGLPQIQFLVQKGAPPITGLENCTKNLQFRGLAACSISQPAGQQPASQLLLFQKGDAYFNIGVQYESQQQLGVFDDVMRSFQFTP